MKNKISKELGSGFRVVETDSKEYAVSLSFDRGLGSADIDDTIKEASRKLDLLVLKFEASPELLEIVCVIKDVYPRKWKDIVDLSLVYEKALIYSGAYKDLDHTCNIVDKRDIETNLAKLENTCRKMKVSVDKKSDPVTSFIENYEKLFNKMSMSHKGVLIL